MCEKLERCRNELSSAIQKALEGPRPPGIAHLFYTCSSLIQCRDSTWAQDTILSPPSESICLTPTNILLEERCDHHADIGKNILPVSCIKWSSKENLVSETFHPSVQDCRNVPQDQSLQDITQDLLDMIESTSYPVMAEILQNLDRSIVFSLDILGLTDEMTPPAGDITDPASSGDQIIELALDLEEDYSILQHAKNQ
ncbi:uncharacterized protein C3orf62 homolog [Dendropsophus ebraccatus]|uniref:uncharacterized protein C3orf62 homolog n=1 Tax=Dendropsophus ebraccatus TaxID=150705 RepID=UPI003831A9B0